MSRLALPFLADETPADRQPLRLLLALGLGGLVAVAAALIGGFLAIGLFTWAAHALGADSAGPPVPINDVLNNPALAANSLRLGLVLLVMAAAVNGAAAFGFVRMAAAVIKRRFGSYFTVAPKFRWGLVATGLGLHVLLLGPLMFWESWGEISAGRFPLMTMTSVAAYRVFYVVVAVITVFIAALAEEILFRGWLLRHLAALLRNPWIAMAAGALLFSAAHMEFTPAAFLIRAIMGAGFAWMTLRTGGVELASGVHMANNLLLTIFVQPLTLVSNPNWTLSPSDLLELASVAAGYLIIAEVAVRLLPRRPLADEADPEASAAFQ
jgi:membrane protease YdiL (CAAX protease family)